MGGIYPSWHTALCKVYIDAPTSCFLRQSRAENVRLLL